jgi:hypothetical protein
MQQSHAWLKHIERAAIDLGLGQMHAGQEWAGRSRLSAVLKELGEAH